MNISSTKMLPLYTLSTSVIVTLVLMLIALPRWLDCLRPQLVVLILIYWVLYAPQRMGIMMVLAWSLGIVLDVVFNTFLGVNALALVLVVYASLKWQMRFNFFVPWQKTIFVFSVTFLSFMPQLCSALIVKNYASINMWLYLLSSLTSALIFPYFTYFIDLFRRSCN